MSERQPIQAAPPDDGNHEGTFTTPESMMLHGPDDTRAQETIGTEPLKPRRPNTGYTLFMLATVTLVVLFAVISQLGMGR